MSYQGVYYLHTNGDLIYKPGTDSVPDIRESNFACGLWFVDPRDRAGAWSIVVESLAGGANPDRVRELATKWGCTDEDAEKYAEYIAVKLFKDGAQWCATRSDFINLQESPAGFGERAYEALAALAKELGYEPATMWGTPFQQLVGSKQ